MTLDIWHLTFDTFEHRNENKGCSACHNDQQTQSQTRTMTQSQTQLVPSFCQKHLTFLKPDKASLTDNVRLLAEFFFGDKTCLHASWEENLATSRKKQIWATLKELLNYYRISLMIPIPLRLIWKENLATRWKKQIWAKLKELLHYYSFTLIPLAENLFGKKSACTLYERKILPPDGKSKFEQN